MSNEYVYVKHCAVNIYNVHTCHNEANACVCVICLFMRAIPCMCAFQCSTLSLSGAAGLAMNFLLECMFITPSEQRTLPQSDFISPSHSNFCSFRTGVNMLLPFSQPSFYVARIFVCTRSSLYTMVIECVYHFIE